MRESLIKKRMPVGLYVRRIQCSIVIIADIINATVKPHTHIHKHTIIQTMKRVRINALR